MKKIIIICMCLILGICGCEKNRNVDDDKMETKSTNLEIETEEGLRFDELKTNKDDVSSITISVGAEETIITDKEHINLIMNEMEAIDIDSLERIPENKLMEGGYYCTFTISDGRSINIVIDSSFIGYREGQFYCNNNIPELLRTDSIRDS